MKKRIIAVCIVALVAALFYAIHLSRNARIGIVHESSVVLISGTYQQGISLDLDPDTYAVYAKKGRGTVRFGKKVYKLDASLYNEAKKQPRNAANAILYEESPKLSIDKGSKLILKGDSEFSVTFLRR